MLFFLALLLTLAALCIALMCTFEPRDLRRESASTGPIVAVQSESHLAPVLENPARRIDEDPGEDTGAADGGRRP